MEDGRRMGEDMPYAAAVLTALGAIAALAVARLERRWPYALAKAVAAAGFVWLALSVGATATLAGTLLLAGLVASAAGDVALAQQGPAAFLAGTAAFALAHAAYAASCLTRGTALPWLAVAAVAVVAVSLLAWHGLRARVPGALRAAIAGYLVLVSAMVALAWGAVGDGATLALGVGATAFYLSDLAVARERFLTHSFGDKLWGLPLYYVAQVLIALSAAR